MYRAYRLKHIGKTDPQCSTVQFCFRSGRLTCSARTGFTAIATPVPLISKVGGDASHGPHGAVAPMAVSTLYDMMWITRVEKLTESQLLIVTHGTTNKTSILVIEQRTKTYAGRGLVFPAAVHVQF